MTDKGENVTRKSKAKYGNTERCFETKKSYNNLKKRKIHKSQLFRNLCFKLSRSNVVKNNKRITQDFRYWKSRHADNNEFYNSSVREYHRIVRNTHNNDIRARSRRENAARRTYKAKMKLLASLKSLQQQKVLGNDKKRLSKRGKNELIARLTVYLRDNEEIRQKLKVESKDSSHVLLACKLFAENAVNTLEQLRQNTNDKSRNILRSLNDKLEVQLQGYYQLQTEQNVTSAKQLSALAGPCEHSTLNMPYFCNMPSLQDYLSAHGNSDLENEQRKVLIKRAWKVWLAGDKESAFNLGDPSLTELNDNFCSKARKEDTIFKIDKNGTMFLPNMLQNLDSEKYSWSCADFCSLSQLKETQERLCSIFSRLVFGTLNTLKSYIISIDDCTSETEKSFNRHFGKERPESCSMCLDDDRSGNSSCLNFIWPKGHPIACHDSLKLDASQKTTLCKSDLLFLKSISSHYPQLRRIVQQIYDLKKYVELNFEVTDALTSDDMEKLCLTAERRSDCKVFHEHDNVENRPTTDSKAIKDNHKSAFTLYHAEMQDLPMKVCISCHMFKKRKRVSDISYDLKHLETATNEGWKKLLEANKILDRYEEKVIKKNEYFVCITCKGYFQGKNGDKILPPTCILNNLQLDGKWPEFDKLGEYGLLLVKRAHGFQTITTCKTIASKNLPSHQKIRKAKGSALHIPIDTNAAVKEIDQHTPVTYADVSIALRSAPNARMLVWEDVVNVSDLYKCLDKLKSQNNLYQHILLPKTAIELAQNYLQKPINVYQYKENTPDSDEIEPKDNNIKSNVPCNEEVDSESLIKYLNEDEKIYDNHTIMSLSKSRLNKEAKNIFKDGTFSLDMYGIQRTNKDPINEYNEQNLEAMEYPHLYPTGKGHENDQRNTKIIPSQFAKQRMYNKDNRFRRDPTYNFYLQQKAQKRQINNGMFTMLNTANSNQKLTGKQIVNKIENGQLDSNISTIYSKVRGTQAYMSRAKQELNAMLKTYGPATWWFTLSPNEWLWDDELKPFMEIFNPEWKGKKITINEMVSRDPIAMAIFMENKFQATLKFMLAKDNPIGEIDHYFIRREYQGRGMPHFHLIIWVKNSPVIGENDDDEIAAFIGKYVTCAMPSRNSNIFKVVKQVQQHKCNSYCLRKGKRKKAQCKFGYPREISRFMKINGVEGSIAGRKTENRKRTLYDIPRKESERFINDYNPAVMSIWRSNMDIQFVGEYSGRLTTYICKYACKAENSNINTDFLNSTTKSVRSALFTVAMKGLSSREVSSLEAADTNLGFFMYKTDPKTNVIHLNVSKTEYRKLKKHTDLKTMDSTDIFDGINWITDVYGNRPAELEATSLYKMTQTYRRVQTLPKKLLREATLNEDLDKEQDQDAELVTGNAEEEEIVSNIEENDFNDESTADAILADSDHVNKECDDYESHLNEESSDIDIYKPYFSLKSPKDMGYLVRRKTPACIYHYQHNFETKPDDYQFSLLKLFKPWHDISDIQGDSIDINAAFNLELRTNPELQKYHQDIQSQNVCNLELDQKIEEIIKQEDEDKDKIPAPFDVSEETIDDTLHEIQEMTKHKDGSIGWENQFLQMNNEQKEAFLKVVLGLHKQLIDVPIPPAISDSLHLIEKDNLNNTQMLLFVSGDGGTGKSFIISAVKSYVNDILKKKVVVTAPTGVAAKQVDGMTLHRLFQLPVEHNNTAKYNELGDSVIESIRNELKDVILFVIDEISMVSNVMLLYVHKRLQDIYSDMDNLFGNQNLLVTGDLLQLTPVSDGPCYKTVDSKVVNKVIGGYGELNIWEHFSYTELTQSERHRLDSDYGKILRKVRIGKLEKVDQDTLEERKHIPKGHTSEERINEVVDLILKDHRNNIDATCLMPTNHMCEVFNSAVLKKLPGDILEIQAEDFMRYKVRAVTNEKSIGILKEKISNLDKDSRTTAGLEAKLSLKLGSKVMLKRNIDVSKGLCNGSIGKLVDVVREHNNKITQLIVQIGNEKHKITKVQAQFFITGSTNCNVCVHRTQFPLCSAYAITVHKSQGMTLERAYVDCGNSTFASGMTYVAMSRVKTLKGLTLLNLAPDKIKADLKTIEEYNRLRSTIGLDPLRKICSTDSLRIDRTQKDSVYVNRPVKNMKNKDPAIAIGNNYLLPGLKRDGWHCYANSILQVILNLDDIANHLNINNTEEDNNLQSFFTTYKTSCSMLDPAAVIYDAGITFTQNQFRDPMEFLINLFSKYKQLGRAFEIRQEVIKECLDCRGVINREAINTLHYMQMALGSKATSMQSLIEKEFMTPKTTVDRCNGCFNNLIKTRSIIKHSEYLIIKCQDGKQVGVTDGPSKPLNLTKILHKNVKYWLVGAVLYANNHFTSLVKKRIGNKHQLYLCDEEKITKLARWPSATIVKNGDSEYSIPYLLIYCKDIRQRSS